MRHRQPPAARERMRGERARIVAVGAALEAVEQHQQARGRALTGKVDVDEIAVRRFPALALQCDASRRMQRRVEGLQVPARQPPGSRVAVQCRIFGGASRDAASSCAGAGEAWCTIMRQPAGVRRYTLVAMTGGRGRGSPSTVKFSCTLCTSIRSEEHTSEPRSRENLVCRRLVEKKKKA